MLEPITENETRQLVQTWFSLLTSHATVEEYIPVFAFSNVDFKIQFASLIIRNLEDFKHWYGGYIYDYFDEIHTLKEISISYSPLSGCAEVKAIEHWEASMWKPSAAKSERMIVDAHQNWIVMRSPTTHQLMFKSYIPSKFDFAEGSARPVSPTVQSEQKPGDNEIKSFVYAWYSWFDQLEDDSNFLAHLSTDNLLMNLTNLKVIIHNHVEFKQWWKVQRGNLKTNFHDITNFKISRDSDDTIGIDVLIHYKGESVAGQVYDHVYRLIWKMSYFKGNFIISRYSVEDPLKNS